METTAGDLNSASVRRSDKIGRRALIVGASGIIGNSLVRLMAANDWEAYALARTPPTDVGNAQPVSADVLDPVSLRAAVGRLRPTHVFLAAWLQQPTEAENIIVNGRMVRNVLDARRVARCSTSH